MTKITAGSKKEVRNVPLDPAAISAAVEGSELVAGNVLLGDVYIYQEGKVTPEGRKALKDSGIELPPEPEPEPVVPTIVSLNPTQGADGSQLIIAGTNFGAGGPNAKVQVGTEDAALAEWLPEQITVGVMQGAQPMSAPLVVTVTTEDGQQAMSTSGYTFLDAGSGDV
jgi:hypothetical protein